MRTVRDATFDVFRRFGMTTIFANPGSTEISFLAGLPDDIRFVLALHVALLQAHRLTVLEIDRGKEDHGGYAFTG